MLSSLIVIIGACAHVPTAGNSVSRRSAIAIGGAAAAARFTKPAAAGGPVIAGGPLPLTIGQGTCLVRPGQAQNIVNLGIQCGYRVFDTAQRYGNEAGLGIAIREAMKAGTIKREEVFVTTKIWVDNMGKERAENSVRQSAQDLGLGSIDLVLIHWPGKFIKRGDPDNDRTNRQLREETWAALEKLRQEGLVKSIGVSNFSERHLKELLSYGKPSVNQFECREWRRLHQPRAAAHLPLTLLLCCHAHRRARRANLVPL